LRRKLLAEVNYLEQVVADSPARLTVAEMMLDVDLLAKLERFDCSVFTGEYVTQDISADYLNQLELFRSDAAKEALVVQTGKEHVTV